jgi:hypothetical protein
MLSIADATTQSFEEENRVRRNLEGEINFCAVPAAFGCGHLKHHSVHASIAIEHISASFTSQGKGFPFTTVEATRISFVSFEV